MDEMYHVALTNEDEFTRLYNSLSYSINKYKRKYYTIDEHTFESIIGQSLMTSLDKFKEELGKFSSFFAKTLEGYLIKHLQYMSRKGRNLEYLPLDSPDPTTGREEAIKDSIPDDFNLEEHILINLDIHTLNIVINFIDEDLRDVVLFRAIGYSQEQVGDKLGLHQAQVSRMEKRAYRELKFWMEDGMDAIRQYKVLADLGMKRQEIADHLGVKPDTVSRYKDRLKNYNKAINCKAVMDGERNVTYFIGELARYERKTEGLLIKGIDSDEFILAPDKLKEFISEYEDALKILS